ncbi:MAG: hypothetical protein U0X73_07940 [Thermoanaerobaculia bacterium]
MKDQLSASAEQELARSSLFLWASGQTLPARLALLSVHAAAVVVLAAGVLMFFLEASWPEAVGAGLLVLLVLAYCVLMFVHTTLFEAALRSDRLLSESEKSMVKVNLLIVPFARTRLRRRLMRLAERRASQPGSTP